MVSSPGQTVVGIPLLGTKLYIPTWRPGLVSRPRLIERLDQGIERKLTVVSAPADFGKTTLLAEWLATTPAGERPAGWVSLDQSDNDPALFWAYVITALQTARPELGERALSLLQSPQPPPIESVLTTLINEITAIEDDFALILDDFHVIDAQPVHSAIAFLLDHLPPRMHLVIASRSDPPLPLARLRGRGDSTELRISDLRFTSAEAAAFLNEVMGLDRSAADVAALATRTDGWRAGLQLAARSSQGRADGPGFISAGAGADRSIADYLGEEVRRRQPARIRSFLLQTSMLDRLRGPRCAAVTGRDDGQGVLAVLERGNRCVVPLDAQRHWYRYHHLFADVLRAHAMAEQPDRAPPLHRRAAAWFEEHGMAAAAIAQARAAGDHETVARLLAATVEELERTGRYASVSRWSASLPDEMVRSRPRLALIGAAAALPTESTVENVRSALPNLERGGDHARRARNPRRLATVLAHRGQVRVALGRVDDGRRSLEEALLAGHDASTEVIWAMCAAHAWRAEVLLAAGDTKSAMEQVDAAHGFARGVSTFRCSSFLTSVELKIYCRTGDLEAAAAVARERGLSPDQAQLHPSPRRPVSSSRCRAVNSRSWVSSRQA